GSYNMFSSLRSLLTASEKKPMNLISSTYEHSTSKLSTFNLYELFASSARSSADDDTFSSLSSAQKAYRYFHSTKFDYVFLEMGRNYSIISESSRKNNINSAVKLARLAVEKNPNVKIILIGPYAHMTGYSEFESMEKPITDFKSHAAAINAELEATKQAVLRVTKNVAAVSLSDLFLAYNSDPAAVKAELYREDNGDKTMANIGNGASAKGAYLAAAALCAEATGKSPTGLGFLGYESSSVKGKLEKDDAIAMQKLASKFILGDEGKVPETFRVGIDPLNGTPPVFSEAKEGDKLEKPEEPVREGYIFKGWYADYEYTKEFDFDKDAVPFGGLTVVARWKLIVDRSTPPEIKNTNVTTGDVGRSPTVLIVGAGVFTRTDQTLPHDFVPFFEELLKKDGYNATIRKRIQPINYNLWEEGLAGKNNSLIEEQLSDGKVDVLVLQSTRDTPLIWDSSADREINAVNSICELAKSYNPDTKIVYVVSYARQDIKSSYNASNYKSFVDADIVEREEFAYAINSRMNTKMLPAMKHKMTVVDVNRVFEYLIKNTDVNPWNGNSDFAGKYGDYAMACAVYAGVTGKSPVGLMRFTTKKAAVEPKLGVVIQQTVARIVLKQENVPEVDLPDGYVDRMSANALLIGGRTVNDNKLPETLGFFLRQIGKEHEIKALSGESSLAKYKDSTAVNVEFNYGGETYDHIVLEIGRDAVLYDEKAAAEELAAIEKLVALGKENNPAVKIVLLAPAARQNTAGQFFKNQAEHNGVTSTDGYAKLISAYAKKLAGENYEVCDLAAAAHLAAERGINPYADGVSDYLSEEGSYLEACMLYNVLYGAMPDEINYPAGLDKETAETLRQVAASLFAD
ncbi:MAG: InlB B-repeat-containing protein, partial [Clostridia bacterium]|nr:InlB B-repeat-containing protein [Clostridia bacterium]